MTQTAPQVDGNAQAPIVTPVVIPVHQVPSALPTQQRFSAPTGRLAAELEDRWRWIAAFVAGLSLVYGGILAWREQSNGVAVAALFGVGLISLVFALAGVVPASVKVGDLEVKLEQAQEQGKQEGSLHGLQAAAMIAKLPPAERAEMRAQVESALTRALSTEAPLSVPQLGLMLPVPQMEEADARAQAAAITDALVSS